MRLLNKVIVVPVGLFLIFSSCTRPQQEGAATVHLVNGGPTEAPPSVPVSARAVTAPPPQVEWCHLALGASPSDALRLMDAANGTKVAAAGLTGLLSAGQTFLEWDYGNDIFLATFSSGAAIHLQAYDQEISPIGAKDISCPPFRNR